MRITPDQLKSLERSPLVRSGEIQTLAGTDPVLAATLVSGLLSPGGYADTGGWEMIPFAAHWSLPTAGQRIRAEMFSKGPGGATDALGNPGRGQSGGGVLEANLWVRAVTYTVRRPNAYTDDASIIFKAQSDWAFSKNPPIDVSLQFVTPDCKALVAVGDVPIENVPVAFEESYPAGFFSRQNASVNCTMVNTHKWDQTYFDPLPIEAIVVLHCWRLPGGAYDHFQQDAARALLRELGYAA